MVFFRQQHLTKKFITINKESLEYKLIKLKTINSMTDKNSTLLVYTYRNNHTPIKIKNTFKYAACFDDEGQLIYYGKYNNGNRITGLFLNQSKQIGMFIRSLTSVTYYNGKENYNNYYSKESIIYDSKYSYKEWIINKIKIIEK